MGLPCAPQVGRPSAKACQACGVAKARCSLADVAPSVGAAPSDPDIEVVAPSRSRARVGNAEAQYRQEKLALRRESVEALKRMAASQEESTRLLRDGVDVLTDLTRRLVVSPNRPQARPPPRPSAVPSAASGPSRALSGAIVNDRARKRPRAESTPAPEDEDEGGDDGEDEEGMEMS